MSVTVVIPAYNAEATLYACLSAPGLRAAEFQPRIIVADNASTDPTAEVAVSLGAEVVSARRPGPASARNAGLELVETEFVAFIDADCIAHAGWVDSLLRAIRHSPHAGVGGALEWHSNTPEVAAFYQAHYPRNYELVNADPVRYVLTSNAIFRTEKLKECGGLDARLPWCEDLELGIRLANEGATLGYAADAVVGVHTPRTGVDRLAQFYKYGNGLARVRKLHPDAIPWNPAVEWRSLSHELRSLRHSTDWRDALRLFGIHLTYFAGWVDGALTQRLAQIGAQLLPIRSRLEPTNKAVRQVGLTIDDGPSEVTPDLLRLLRQHRARASFFVIGERARRHPEVIAELVADGHEVYAHGWSHRRVDCLAPTEIQNEFARTEDLLSAIRPTPRPYLVRLPYGAGRDDAHVHAALRGWNRDCEIIDWSTSLDDWTTSASEASAVHVDRILDEAARGEDLLNAILLMHDSPYGLERSRAGRTSVQILEHTLRRMHAEDISVISLEARQ